LDVRGTYANTQRKSPYERSFVYEYNRALGDYINQLSGNSRADVAFSDLSEDLWAGAADVSYALPTVRPIKLSAGYAYTDTSRTSSRFTFEYKGPNFAAIDQVVAQLRPDYLLSDYTIQ